MVVRKMLDIEQLRLELTSVIKLVSNISRCFPLFVMSLMIWHWWYAKTGNQIRRIYSIISRLVYFICYCSYNDQFPDLLHGVVKPQSRVFRNFMLFSFPHRQFTIVTIRTNHPQRDIIQKQLNQTTLKSVSNISKLLSIVWNIIAEKLKVK